MKQYQCREISSIVEMTMQQARDIIKPENAKQLQKELTSPFNILNKKEATHSNQQNLIS